MTPTVSGGKAPYSYNWIFGDGNSSKSEKPSHTYVSLGCGTKTYKVLLTVTDANGCSASIEKEISIKQAPDVQIEDEDIFSPFNNCGKNPTKENPDFTITVNNSSPSKSCIISYSVNWGDGTIENNVSFPLTHTYKRLGAFDLVVTAKGANGCTNSKKYVVANQSNPAGGLGTLGSTTGLCAPADVPFIISNWENNSPGTTYLLDFGDGTSVTLQHPLNPDFVPHTVTHTYTKTSCPQPTFTATLKVINACDETPYSAGNIQVRIKPTASFTSNSSVCVGQSICFTNTTVTGFTGSNCASTTEYIWDFGDGSPTVKSQGNPCHTYTKAGTYTVTLSATNPCGTTTYTKEVCVTAAAISAFNLDQTLGCGALIVKATNTSNTLNFCAGATYRWDVSYTASNCGTTGSWSFAGNSNASSLHPSFSFSSPGTYTISLAVTNACGTVSSNKTVIVKSPPTVTIASIPNACGPVTINPTALISNCGTSALSYKWTFEGGSPATSSSADPGPIQFNGFGNHAIRLEVTNECGTTTATQSFTINPLPDLKVPDNQAICIGQIAGPFNFSSATPSTNITWSTNNRSIGLPNTTGSGNINAFTAVNSTTSPNSSLITVTAAKDGCTAEKSFSVTVNPRPKAPTTANLSYCKDAVALPLTAIGIEGFALNWYNDGGTKLPTAPTPVTTTVGSKTYYVSQTDPNTGCESDKASLTVSVKPKPIISSSSSSNATSCGTSTGTITLKGLTPFTTYSISYFKDGGAQTKNISSSSTGDLIISGLSSGTYNNITASLNGCASGEVGPFTISDPNPPATPTASNNGPICSGGTINLTANSTTPGVIYTWSGPNGFTRTGANVSIPNAAAAATGTYSVTATLNGCTSAAGTTSVVVNQTPLMPSVQSNGPLCSGSSLNLSASTSTNGTIAFSWTGPNGFTSMEQNPVLPGITTAATGAYQVKATLGNCSSANTTNVLIYPASIISGSSSSNPTHCGAATGSITLKGLEANITYTVRYQKGSITQSSSLKTNAAGELIIANLNAGTYSKVYVERNGCSSNEVGPFELTDPNPPAAPIISPIDPLCVGATLHLSASTSTPGNAIYSWRGPDGFTSNLQNPSKTGITTAAAGTYTVIIDLNGCTASTSTQVTVNDKPVKPTVVSPLIYCQNEIAAPLNATGNNLTWYTQINLSDGVTTPPTPNTAIAGIKDYYVTQTNSAGCNSDAAIVTVQVNPLISNNIIGNDQTLCTGGTPQPITSKSGIKGGDNNYTYIWQYSEDGGNNWTTIPGAQLESYTPQALMSTTHYRRIVRSVSCSDTSNAVMITIQGSLTNFNISGSQVLCEGAIPEKITGEQPSGGDGTYVYLWERRIENGTWEPISNVTTQDFQPGSINRTTSYRRKVTSGPCAVYSNTITITINQLPKITQIDNQMVCNGTAITVLSFTSNPTANVTYSWTNDNTSIGLPASGTGNISAFVAANNSNPKVPVKATLQVTGTNTAENLSCAGPTMTFDIVVLPFINLEPIADEVVCTGSRLPSFVPKHNAGVSGESKLEYKWEVSGQGTNLLAGKGAALPAIVTSNPGSTDLVTRIVVTPLYSVGDKICEGEPAAYQITVKPATPASSAGPDVTLCAATTYQMRALGAPGTVGKWSQISGPPVIITDITSPSTAISGLTSGHSYEFQWTVQGFATCPPTTDNVIITVVPPISNSIQSGTQTICFGQSVTVSGQIATGGQGTIAYQWKSSEDQINWIDIPGQSGAQLTFQPTQTLFVKRIAKAAPCESESEIAQIIVQAPISNNTIHASQQICVNTIPQPLTGTSPLGSNGTFQYQWQLSTNNGATWEDIPSAHEANYFPPALIRTTSYRRIVNTALCSGAQSSISNEVTITINPDAKAAYLFTKDTACAPFVINNAIVNLQLFPERNKDYEWYVNNSLIGTGTTFPGYTIPNSGDAAIIKLKAISQFGCLSDSVEHQFVTIVEPEPSFTISTQSGCGPLEVALTNTTPNQNAFRYYWNFGNRQTSVATQPGKIIFQPNPNYSDTTYTITLNAITDCDTITVTKSVLVKSKPKALFTPNKSVGCSPMRVTFNNTSLGDGNSYIWDFGDGTRVSSQIADTISHTFITGVQDTFHVKLIAVNECGSDTLSYAIVVSPNKIFLDFALNGNEQTGCTPHTVRFVNNSKGASSFRWDFGDGNILSTTRNIDTVTHTYQQAGDYTVRLWATNGCSDTSTLEKITVYPKPLPAFRANSYNFCIGDTISLTNASEGATSYLWMFGDGNTSSLVNPVHKYRTPGSYVITLKSYRTNTDGTVCVDSLNQTVQVVNSLAGWFDATDTISNCAPLTVTFTNRQLRSTTATWDFGDGQKGTGNTVTHTFNQAGTYKVTLTSVAPEGCTYITTRMIQVLGPSGKFSYESGYLCGEGKARFQVQADNTDSIRWNFGDGSTIVTKENIVYHVYSKAGVYLPSVTLMNKAGCSIDIKGIDSIRIDKIKAGFTTNLQQQCSSTTAVFTDTTNAFFGKAEAYWNFGDGNAGTGFRATNTYYTSGTYSVQLIVKGNSGCTDTISQKVVMKVNDKPKVHIQGDSIACTNTNTVFQSNIQSVDSISFIDWSLSNGAKGNMKSFTYNFTQTGLYTLRLVVGTVNGCFDTTIHTVRVNAAPSVIGSKDQLLCLGTSTQLRASGAPILRWLPFDGLSCTTCPDPVVTPKVTTTYIVEGTSTNGCSAYDTVLLTVIQPLKMRVTPNDSICIGQSSNLNASGASMYSWSPGSGLSNTSISNPVATPTITTTYRVVGYDGYNCFTDTAFVTVAVGQYPKITLEPDLTLSTGTLHPLNSTVENGPIRTWQWSPSTDLSCSDCPKPIAHIKKNITYTVTGTTAYGCSAKDTINIKVFCENTQLFIPNAFSPDGDGVNDILMVRGKGIASVKAFRIFNRWGEVVFERNNFTPNDPLNGWDGKIRGIVGGPDVFVYTAEVICENGATYTYKGNVSIIK